jgi:hypothetical protein
VFDLQTAIRDDLETGLLSARERLVVADAQLGPDHRLVVAFDGFVDDSRHLLARAKDVDDLDFLVDVCERIVSRAIEDRLGVGIHWNHLVAVFLEVAGDLVGVLSGGGRTADDGYGVECEYLAEFVVALDRHG